MSRKDRIKFKLMEDGHIRAFDSLKMSGISEFQIFQMSGISPTIRTRPDHIKILVTDEAIAHYLKQAARRL